MSNTQAALQKLLNRQYIHSRAIPPTPPNSLDFWLHLAAGFHALILGSFVVFYMGMIFLFAQTLTLINQLGGGSTVSNTITSLSQGLRQDSNTIHFGFFLLPFILSIVSTVGFAIATTALLLMIRTKKKFGINSVQFDRLLVLFVSGYLVWIVCTVGSFIPAQIFGGK